MKSVTCCGSSGSTSSSCSSNNCAKFRIHIDSILRLARLPAIRFCRTLAAINALRHSSIPSDSGLARQIRLSLAVNSLQSPSDAQHHRLTAATRSPSTRPNAPTGAMHPPRKCASSDRSAVTAARVAASSSGRTAANVLSSSARHSIPSAPCPTAGSITSNGNTCEMRSANPNRRSPASPARSHRTAPHPTSAAAYRHSRAHRPTCKSGRTCRNCACRRKLPVPHAHLLNRQARMTACRMRQSVSTPQASSSSLLPSPSHQHIRRTLALRHRRQHQPFHRLRRQILQTVHGQIDFARQAAPAESLS